MVKNRNKELPRVKGIRYKLDDSKLHDSTSGGFFLGIADHILRAGGIVYGAAFNKKNEVIHIGIEDIHDIRLLQGSKYVQSRLGNIFADVWKHLEKDRVVLFTGTPCQIAGLKSFLNHEYENLITMDFVCHGVPSPAFFETYLKWLAKKYEEKIGQNEFRFRVKKHGWYYRNQMSYTFKFNNHYKYVGTDPYYTNFLQGNNYRESCYQCKFKYGNYHSDFTAGDFGGVDTIYSDFMDKRGVSLVCCNSERSLVLLEKISDYYDAIEVDIELVRKYNKTLFISTPRPERRDIFYKKLHDANSFDYIEYLRKEIPFKSKIKPYIPFWILKRIKRLNR